MLGVILKSFDTPDKTRVFEKGILEIVRIGGMVLGRASYEPWSVLLGKLSRRAAEAQRWIARLVLG